MTTSRAHNRANTAVATYEGDSAPIWQFVNEVLTARKRHNRKRDRKMAFELIAGQGYAFANKDRAKNDKAPTYRMEIKLDAEIIDRVMKAGGILKAGVWEGTTKNGDAMLSVKVDTPFTPRQQQNEAVVGGEPFCSDDETAF